MEDREGSLTEEVVEPPFSDLMKRWLDEGDQLSASEVTSAAAAAAHTEAPLRQALSRLRAGVERYRLFVLAGVGLLPLALFTATHHGAAGAAVAASTVSAAPTATGFAPSPPNAPRGAAVAASRISVAAHETPVAAPTPASAARTTAVGASNPPRAVHATAVPASKLLRAVHATAVGASNPPPRQSR
jgi:hypothetical protein